jgi:hypothetical protein
MIGKSHLKRRDKGQLRARSGHSDATQALSLRRETHAFRSTGSICQSGGLGLAIVDGVMKQIGGSLTLIRLSWAVSPGSKARLVFPEPN